jgi:hypothetical protein
MLPRHRLHNNDAAIDAFNITAMFMITFGPKVGVVQIGECFLCTIIKTTASSATICVSISSSSIIS